MSTAPPPCWHHNWNCWHWSQWQWKIMWKAWCVWLCFGWGCGCGYEAAATSTDGQLDSSSTGASHFGLSRFGWNWSVSHWIPTTLSLCSSPLMFIWWSAGTGDRGVYTVTSESAIKQEEEMQTQYGLLSWNNYFRDAQTWHQWNNHFFEKKLRKKKWRMRMRMRKGWVQQFGLLGSTNCCCVMMITAAAARTSSSPQHLKWEIWKLAFCTFFFKYY